MRAWTILTPLALLGEPALAQRTDAPLGEILEAIEETAERVPPPPAEPLVRRQPGSSIGTVDLPASRIEDQAASSEAGVSIAEPTEAEAYWQAMLDKRRAEINAVEGPLVERLNAEAAVRLATRRDEAKRAQDDYRQAVAEHQAGIRRAQEEHQAELERYRQKVIRQRAEHEARVRACLDGVRDACMQRGE